MISTETIYKFIYGKEGRKLELFRLLDRSHFRRRWPHKRDRKREIIKNKVSIHDRPEHINDRSEVGHYEGDLVVSKGSFSQVLLVMIERSTRAIQVRKLPKKDAQTVLDGILEIVRSASIPVKSITFDNGTEFAKHYILRKDHNIMTYFCDVYASWQKGSVERANRLIRRFLPRTIPLSEVSQRLVQEVQESINQIPRKCLNYLTPQEVVSGALSS